LKGSGLKRQLFRVIPAGNLLRAGQTRVGLFFNPFGNARVGHFGLPGLTGEFLGVGNQKFPGNPKFQKLGSIPGRRLAPVFFRGQFWITKILGGQQ